MIILSTSAIRRSEEKERACGISEEELMERAGKGCAERILEAYPGKKRVLALIGRGNNGGDGLVIARRLARVGREVTVSLSSGREGLGRLCAKKLSEWEAQGGQVAPPGFPLWAKADLVLDALLGIGMSGELRDEMAELVSTLNAERTRRFFRTVAIDTPSGLWDGASAASTAVVADLTLTVGYGKDFLFREALSRFVGRIEVVPIFSGGEAGSGAEAIVPEELARWLPRRSAHCHKNQFGRVLLLGGSRGFTGAPAMAANAAHRVGAGLVTLGVREEIYPIVAARSRPETMVFPVSDQLLLSSNLSRATVVAIGPGLGLDRAAEDLLALLVEANRSPAVFDADALTLLARNPGLFDRFRFPAVLTPHPGEMSRLLGREIRDEAREEAAREFVERTPATLVLKGTRTLVVQKGSPFWYNTTGNPGLAAGGSGDILLGMLAGLIAQGIPPWEAAKLGVWLHGRAADLLLQEKEVEEGILASEVAERVGAANRSLRAAARRALREREEWSAGNLAAAATTSRDPIP
ncbi:bifunctional ADP-dependent NAD(P)H-hydrate dehydratase/NAD(P)H-hydrate epimerase [Verrucomicrobium sp. 3C]|uniref:bifunctional ADP-dependent NAD(P)H-hydrate dehydratase/NAD(P)H-hydrate epimerase n=1 Tax=Verrucomicrobium sp. 3C TaxID=1134055 RepID=UPI00036FAC5C|nr:bifunctional ADP-dependent NAD(P)H-hydrate dehydratase/NAD(P)H-hydrate epimerase [Verrucomicrobium sp. 3C]